MLMCKALRLSNSCWCYFSLCDFQKTKQTGRSLRVILKNIFLVVTRSIKSRTDLQKNCVKRQQNGCRLLFGLWSRLSASTALKKKRKKINSLSNVRLTRTDAKKPGYVLRADGSEIVGVRLK